jgi:hypothetical protein
MTHKLIITTLACLALSSFAAQAQQQPGMGPQAEQRFQMMDRMMEDARKSRGPERQKQIQQHMGAMQEQMQGMRPMMRGGMQSPGQGPMGPGGGPNLAQMQERMDMMQRMMEQMLKHDEMMLDSQQR